MSGGPGDEKKRSFLSNTNFMRLLTEGSFGIYLGGNAISLTGSWMQRVACLYLIWEMTRSAFWLGVLSMVDMLPVLVLGLWAGAAADRWSRLRLTQLCQLVIAVNALIFGLCSSFGFLNLPIILGLSAIQGCTVAIAQPARMALVQVLVPRERVGAAVALSSVNLNISRLIGPAIAGLMLVSTGVQWIFFLNAALTLVFILVLLRLPRDAAAPKQNRANMLGQMIEGLSFTVRNEAIRALLFLLMTGGMALRSMSELFPAFAARDFVSTASGIAALTSSMAAGAIAAGVSLGMGGRPRSLGVRVGISWIFGSICVGLLALSAVWWFDMVCAALTGFFVMRAVISTQTFVQLAAPEHVRGRVLGVHGIVSRGSPAIGAVCAGWAIDRFGLTMPVLILAVLCAIAALLLLRDAENFSHRAP